VGQLSEDDVRVRHRLALLALGTVLLSVGCGGSQPASRTAADTQVNSASCATSGGAGKPTTQSCKFVLSDGRRLRCNRDFVGPTPSVAQLLRDGCRWLTPLKLSASMRAVIARIDRVRGCLTSKGLRAVGGPAFPSRPRDPAQPDGELVITSRTPSFVAFYTDAAKASRTLPALRRLDAGKHVQLERRGAVTIAWTNAPAEDVRSDVWGCVT
jgi:hypothetical protein